MRLKLPPRAGEGKRDELISNRIEPRDQLKLISIKLNIIYIIYIYNIQRNPAVAHFKGLVDFMPYCERCLIANIYD